MTYYVKLVGSKEMPMPDDAWGTRGDLEDQIRFPEPEPKEITPGDELVHYAVGGTKHIFATALVESRPTLSDVHPNPVVAKKWPWASDVTVRKSTKLKYVSSGCLLDEVTPGLQAKIGHGVSHFEIGRPEFERAVTLLQRAKDRESKKLKTGWTP